MGVLCVIYLVCALRTNLVFVMIFFTLVPAFALLTAGFWFIGKGNAARAGTLIIAGGAFAFVTCVCGWWIFFAILLASLDFPFQLPGKCLPTIMSGMRQSLIRSYSLRSLHRHQGRELQSLDTPTTRKMC